MKRAEVIHRFTALAKRFGQLRVEQGKIVLEQAQLSFAESKRIVTEAFPQAEIQEIKSVLKINPKDLGTTATEGIKTLRELNITPTLIILDLNQLTIIVANPDEEAPCQSAKRKNPSRTTPTQKRLQA